MDISNPTNDFRLRSLNVDSRNENGETNDDEPVIIRARQRESFLQLQSISQRPLKKLKVKLLLPEVETDEQKLRRLRILHPEGLFITIWSLYLGFLVLYLALAIPLEVGFNNSSDSTFYNTVINRLATISLGLDIIIHCNTTYVDLVSGLLVTDRNRIIKHYLTSRWFIVDLIATFPFDAIVQAALVSKKTTLIRLVRILRFVRLVKLLETKETNIRIFSQFLPPTILGLVTLLLRVGFVAHIIACFWYFIATPAIGGSFPITWINDPDRHLALATLGEKYVTSLYFTIVTMLTIGYGDITATNQAERVFAIMTMLTGVIVVAFLINQMNAIIASQNQHLKLFKQKVDQFQVDMLKVNVPAEVRSRAKRALEYYLMKRSTIDEQSILSELSLPIRRSLIEKIYASELTQLRNSIPISSSALLFELVVGCKPFVGWSGDELYSQGDVMEEIIFIKSGMILASINTPIIGNPQFTRYMACLSDGELFGDMECMLKQSSLATYTVHRHSLMIAIPAHKFREILNSDTNHNDIDDDSNVTMEFCRRKWQKFQLVTQEIKEETARLFTPRMDSYGMMQLQSHLKGHIAGRIYMHGDIVHLGSHAIAVNNRNHDTSNKRHNYLKHNNNGRDISGASTEQRIIRCLALIDKKEIVVERSIAEVHEKWIILPFDSNKRVWDVIITIVILFTIIVIPPQIVFSRNSQDLRFEIVTDFLTNFVFFVDLLLSFRTSFFVKDRDAFCISRKLIAKQYLRSGWFVVDILASLPFGVFLLAYHSHNHNSKAITSFVGVLRAIKLIRIVKVIQLPNYLSSVEESLSLSPRIFALFEVLLQAFLIAHWLACLWWGITSTISEYPWFTAGQVYGRLQGAKPIAQYLVSLYFVFTTVTTTGYGDIHAVNANERVVVIVLSVIGVIVFSYIIANVTSIISTFVSSNDTFIERIGHVKNFLDLMQCPSKLRQRILNQYNHRLEHLSSLEIEKTVEPLPQIWRTKILYHVHKAHLEQILLFRFLPPSNHSLVLYLFKQLSALYLEEGCHLLKEGKSGQDIYFIASGTAVVYRVHPQYIRKTAPNDIYLPFMGSSSPQSKKMMQQSFYNNNSSPGNNRQGVQSPSMKSVRSSRVISSSVLRDAHILNEDDELSVTEHKADNLANESFVGTPQRPAGEEKEEDMLVMEGKISTPSVIARTTRSFKFNIPPPVVIDPSSKHIAVVEDDDDDQSSNISFDEVMRFASTDYNENNVVVRQLSDLQQLEQAVKERKRTLTMTGADNSRNNNGNNNNRGGTMSPRLISEDNADDKASAWWSFLRWFGLQSAANDDTNDINNGERNRSSTLTEPPPATPENERVTVDNCSFILKEYCNRQGRTLSQLTADELELIGLKLVGKVIRDDIIGHHSCFVSPSKKNRVSVCASSPMVAYTLSKEQLFDIYKNIPIAGFELTSALNKIIKQQRKIKRLQHVVKNRINFIRFLRVRFINSLWQSVLRFALTLNLHEYELNAEQRKSVHSILQVNNEMEKKMERWRQSRQQILAIEEEHNPNHNQRHSRARNNFLTISEWKLHPNNPVIALDVLKALREESSRVWMDPQQLPHDMLRRVDAKLTKEIDELKSDGIHVFEIEKSGNEVHVLPSRQGAEWLSDDEDIFSDETKRHQHNQLTAQEVVITGPSRHQRMLLISQKARNLLSTAVEMSLFSNKRQSHLRSDVPFGAHELSVFKGRKIKKRKRSRSVDYTAGTKHQQGFLFLQKRHVRANDDMILSWEMKQQLYI